MGENKIVSGVEYTVLTQPEHIRDYVIQIANEEWDPEDFEVHGNDLQNFSWVLEEVDVDNITFGPAQPIATELRPRIEKQLELIDDQEVLPPLILRGSDYLIYDGYARTNAFRKLGIEKCLAYVGRVKIA